MKTCIDKNAAAAGLVCAYHLEGEPCTHCKDVDVAALLAEVEALKAENAEQGAYLKQMIDINVANQAFDSGKDWRQRHKVEDGESFPHWYMRHHALELKYERDKVANLKASERELYEALKESQSHLLAIASVALERGVDTGIMTSVIKQNEITLSRYEEANKPEQV